MLGRIRYINSVQLKWVGNPTPYNSIVLFYQASVITLRQKQDLQSLIKINHINSYKLHHFMIPSFRVHFTNFRKIHICQIFGKH